MNQLQSVAAALALAPAAAAAAPGLQVHAGAAEIRWINAYGGPNEDWINDLVALEDGDFLAVGFLDRRDGDPPSDWRALAVKFDERGGADWRREFGAGGAIDAFWTAREREDGSLVFAGFTTRLGPPGINAYLVAADRDGGLVKEHAYGTPGYDRVTGLAPAPGGFIAAGHTEGLDGRDVLLIGVDQDGAERWRRVFAEPGANGALYIEPAGDGGFIVAGGTSPQGDSDILVMKVDADGDELWRRVIGAPGTDDINHGLAVLADGRIVIAGYTDSWGAGERDILAATLSAGGELLRLETIGGAGDDRAMLAKADGRGRVWIVGRTASAGAGGSDGIIARVDDGRLADGVVLFGGEQDDIAAAIRPLADREALVGGFSATLGGASTDGFVARFSNIRFRPHAAFRRTVVVD